MYQYKISETFYTHYELCDDLDDIYQYRGYKRIINLN